MTDENFTQPPEKSKKHPLVKYLWIVVLIIGAAIRFYNAGHDPDKQAGELIKQQQYDQAITFLDDRLQKKPDDSRALALRGFAYFSKNDYDKALQDYNKALDISPDNQGALYARCNVYVVTEFFDLAIPDCTRVIVQSPNEMPGYLSRGLAYAARTDNEHALIDFSKAIQLAPTNPLLYVVRGMTYSNDGQLDAAQQDFDKAKSINPQTPDLALSRGMLETLKGSPDALADLTQAVQEGPNHAYAVIWLHLAKRHAGIDDAQEYNLNSAKVIDKKWPSSVAALYDGRATIDDVRAQATNRDPAVQGEETCEADYYIGEYYLQQNDKDKAATLLQAAIDQCPQSNSNEKQAAGLELKAMQNISVTPPPASIPPAAPATPAP